MADDDDDKRRKRVLFPEEKDVLAAEAEKFRAQSALFDATARKERAYAEGAELTVTQAVRAERAVLAADQYHEVYFFPGSIAEGSVKACMERLTYWSRTKPGCPIEIVFSSPGGSVIDGLVLFDFIQGTRRAGHYVTTSTLGWAASMAGILLQAGDRRIMAPESWLLIHEVSFGAGGGKIGEIEDEVKWVKRIQERILDIFAKRCKAAFEAGTATKPFTKAALKRGWERKDWWISSDEALEHGLVDEIR